MSFSIFDSTANLVDSFDHRDEARAALEDIVRQDPDALTTTRCSSSTGRASRSVTR